MKTLTKKAFAYLIALFVILWTVIPIVWMTISAFKPNDALYDPNPFRGFVPTLSHFQGLFSGANSLWSYLGNSLLAASISTFISVVFGMFAGYGLARSHFGGKKHLSFWIISTRMAPIAAVIVPLYVVFRSLHLLNSVQGLIIAYLTFNLPFAIWLFNAFFAELPIALEEAARIDGAGRLRTFLHIAVPLVTPGTLTTAILCFIFAWNDYAFAATFTGPGTQTIPIAATQLMTQSGIDWGKLMTIGVVTVLPMIFVGLVVRRWLVQGLTLGAVK
jgi:multiple sugar transport system permease protein